MTAFIAILANTILPVIIIASAGYLLQRRLHFDTRTISRLCLYFLTPCLIFHSISSAQLARQEMAGMFIIAILNVSAMVSLGLLTGWLMRLGRRDRGALAISTAFCNCGNFGLSVCLFAFGERGLQLGVLYFVASSFLTYSLGVLIASRFGQASNGAAALSNVLRMPMLYAAIIGLIANLTELSVPAFIARSTELAGRASVPMMLLLLGMQLTRIKIRRAIVPTSVGTVLRLVVAPLAALPMAGLLGLSGVAYQVAILQSAMPTAVTNVIISEEFDGAPEFTSAMVLLSTLSSVITLTITLYLIQ